MAVVRWNFPNGSNGDLLTPELAGADSVEAGSGSVPTISTDHPLAGVGDLSARFILDGDAGGTWVAKEGLAATSFAYDLYLYTPDSLGGSVYIGWAGMSSWQRSISVLMTGTQRIISLRHNINIDAWQGSVAIPNNTWIRLSIYGTSETSEGAGDGTGRVAWYLGHDVTPQEDSGLITGLETHPFIDRIRVGGKASPTSVTGGVLYMSSWAYDTEATGLIGPAVQAWQEASWQRRSSGVWGPMTIRKRESGAWQDNGSSIK